MEQYNYIQRRNGGRMKGRACGWRKGGSKEAEKTSQTFLPDKVPFQSLTVRDIVPKEEVVAARVPSTVLEVDHVKVT